MVILMQCLLLVGYLVGSIARLPVSAWQTLRSASPKLNVELNDTVEDNYEFSSNLRIEFADGNSVLNTLKSAPSKAKVKSLEIAFCDFCPKDFQRLGSVIQQFSMLENFSMTDLQLIDSDSTSLQLSSLYGSNALQATDKCRKLLMRPVFHGLRRLPHLRHLSFAGCDLKDTEIEALGYVFRNSTQRRVSKFKDCSHVRLPHLETLNLSRNKLTSYSIIQMTQKWSLGFFKLQSLDLSYNCNIGSRGLHILAKSIQDTPERYVDLRNLYLAQIDAYTGSITHLLDALLTPISDNLQQGRNAVIASHLRVLDLSGNFLMSKRNQIRHEEQKQSSSRRWAKQSASLLMNGQKQMVSALEQVAGNVASSASAGIFLGEGKSSTLFPARQRHLKQKNFAANRFSSSSPKRRNQPYNKNSKTIRARIIRKAQLKSPNDLTKAFWNSLSIFLKSANQLEHLLFVKMQLNDLFLYPIPDSTGSLHDDVIDQVQPQQKERKVHFCLNPSLSHSKLQQLYSFIDAQLVSDL